MVCPIMCGKIVEALDQVRIIRFSPIWFSRSIFRSNFGSTYGMGLFNGDRDIVSTHLASQLLLLSPLTAPTHDVLLSRLVASRLFT
jgi:hypothetical protein